MSLISLNFEPNTSSNSKKSLYKVLAISSVAPRLSTLKVVNFDELSPEEQLEPTSIMNDDSRVSEVWIQHEGPLDPINDFTNFSEKLASTQVCVLSGDTLKLCRELRHENSDTSE